MFNPLLNALNESGQRYALKDSARSGKLRAIVQDVTALADAQDTLARLAEAVEQAMQAEPVEADA